MKFRLSVTKYFYMKDEKEKLEKLGFKFKSYPPPEIGSGFQYDYTVIKSKIFVEINSIEELIKFSEEWGELVIHKDYLEIYNGYRE